MAYSVDDIGSVITYVVTSYAADDGATEATITSCMTNGTTGEDCDELKSGVNRMKVEINVPPASITALKIRVYLNSIMSAGDNELMPYTDANSVSATNEVNGDYTSAGVWVEHVCSAAFIAELADISGKCYVGLSAKDGTAKSKVGEVEADVTQTLHTMAGVTYDVDGTALGSCQYNVQRRNSLAPEVWSVEETGTSNASTGGILPGPSTVRIGPPGFSQGFEGLVHTIAHELEHVRQRKVGILNQDIREFLGEAIEILSVGMPEEGIAGLFNDARRALNRWNLIPAVDRRARWARFVAVRNKVRQRFNGATLAQQATHQATLNNYNAVVRP
jgi:hypothetical protein